MPKLCSVCGVTYPDALVFCPADGTTLRSADLREDLVGSVIADRYLVTDILGEGGMGTVYLARHVRLPQQAAIKVLRKEMLQDPAAVARFNREASNASKIDHDRVARVYDFGETDEGVVFLAMEFVPGKTLKALIAEGPMEPMRAANLVKQIGEGLDAAHRMEIVHRDLKPDNVMVIRDGDGEERVKVVDFGIAKAFGDSGGTVLTRTGFVVGTPEFMSPEQLLGGSLDARSDIYALALVAYQCFTGELPFATNTPDHGMAARLVTPPRSLLTVQPTIRWPQQVQAVLDQALARDPANRPPSAGAFARALCSAVDAWLGEVTTQPTRTEWVPAAAPGASPTQAGSATVTAVGTYAPAISPSGGTATVGTADAIGVAPEYTPVAPRPAGRGALLGGILVAALVVGGGAGWAIMRSRDTPTTPVTQADTSTAVNRPVDQPTGGATGTPTTGTPTNGTPTNGGATTAGAGTPVVTPRITPVTGDTATRVATQNGGGRDRPLAASSAAGAAAREAIDSIAKTYDLTSGISDGVAESEARRGVPVIRSLIGSLTSDDDRTWANIKLAQGLFITNDERGACAALATAKRLGRSDAQRRAISLLDGALTCGS